MFSAPRLGPIVRSSMISIGAASEPARSSSAVSLASAVVMRPEIWNAVAELAADHGRGDDLALALLEQQDRHPLADVLARDVAHDARALGVDRQVHRRLLGLAVEAGLGVGQALAGERCTWRLTITGAPLRSTYFSLPNGTGPAPVSAERAFDAVVDHAHLERRGAADDVLGLGRVLHARQLHHDPVGALLLDHRLGHAELVDAVVQGRDVLRDRRRLHPLRGVGLEVAGRA